MIYPSRIVTGPSKYRRILTGAALFLLFLGAALYRPIQIRLKPPVETSPGFQAARRLIEQGEFEQSLRILYRLEREYPRSVPVLIYLSLAWDSQRGQSPIAESWLDRALSLPGADDTLIAWSTRHPEVATYLKNFDLKQMYTTSNYTIQDTELIESHGKDEEQVKQGRRERYARASKALRIAERFDSDSAKIQFHLAKTEEFFRDHASASRRLSRLVDRFILESKPGYDFQSGLFDCWALRARNATCWAERLRGEGSLAGGRQAFELMRQADKDLSSCSIWLENSFSEDQVVKEYYIRGSRLKSRLTLSEVEIDLGLRSQALAHLRSARRILSGLIEYARSRGLPPPSALRLANRIDDGLERLRGTERKETNLPHCLESARGLFDEIVVVDTGSTDRTREIALEFGARVFDFVWIDDFAAARNAALEHATGDYAFWLDADDVIEPAEREKLRALLDSLIAPERSQEGGPPGGDVAYVVRCACDPSPDGTGGETVVDHVRLFPLRPDVRWTWRVHEQIMVALRRANIPVRWSDCIVRHTGYTDLALRARKLQRDSRILREGLKDRPNDPFVLFNPGAIAIEQREWRQALEYLKHSLARSAPTDSITCKLFALIARAHQMLGDSLPALQTCEEGLKYEPADAELWFRKAVVHRHEGESTDAETCWRRILTLRRPERFRSVDMGIYGHMTRRNLAALATERGDHKEVERLWHAVLAECPDDPVPDTMLQRLKPQPLVT